MRQQWVSCMERASSHRQRAGEALSIWTHLLLSYFLQKLSLKLPAYLRPHKINFCPFTSSSDLLTFSYIISSIHSNKLDLQKCSKNSVLSKNLIYDQMTSLQSSTGLVMESYVSFYLIIQSHDCSNNLQKEAQIGFFSVWEGSWTVFTGRKTGAWGNGPPQVEMYAWHRFSSIHC